MISKNLELEPMRARRVLPWTVVASLLLHGVAYAALGTAPAPDTFERKKTQLRFDVVASPKPADAEPPPAPKPEPPKPTKAPEPKPQPLPRDPPGAPEPEPAPPARAPEGVTLAVEGTGNAFSMPLGSGGSLEPTRVRATPPVHAPAVSRAAPTTAPAPSGPPVVAVGDLSSKPTPPSLGTALERNYPADARRRGLSGTAKVRARIDPDGVVRQVTLLDETAAGFGAACTRTLNGSRWAAPKDKAGRSVATEIRYTCRFVVDQ